MEKGDDEMCRLLTTFTSVAVLGSALLALDASPSSAAPASLGKNLIINGDAEAGSGSASGNDVEPIPGWLTSSNFTVVQYGAPAFPDSAVSAAIGGGANFFAGGPDNSFSSATTQAVDVSALASGIDAGADTITLSGDLGGFDGQDDDMTVTALFLNAAHVSLGTLVIGPVTEPDRDGVTTLLFRSISGAVPEGTRSIVIQMDATRFEGSYNDGYADNLSLVMGGGPPAIPEPSTIALLLTGLTGLGARKRLAMLKRAIFS
jgi:hypothetical protein